VPFVGLIARMVIYMTWPPFLGQGLSVEEILAEYPYLTEEDVRAALLYAAEVLSREVVIPLTEAR